MKHYCFFFDWWESHSKLYRKFYNKERCKSRRSSFNERAIGEFNRLQWFLFDTRQMPFNLQYITEQLYDEPGIREDIRNMAREQFKLSLNKAVAAKRFPIVTQYILDNTNIADDIPADKESKLRQARYRLVFD